MHRIRYATTFLVIFSFLFVCGCSDDDSPTADQGVTLAQAKESLSKYEDISVALQDGYIGDLMFISDPETGAGMGIHFFNPAITEIDPYKPQLLLYDVTDDGQYELAGVEWFVSSASVQEAPVLFEHTFNGPMEGHGPGDPEHYDLHVWLFKDNPDGMFEDFNPSVTAPSYMNTLISTHLGILGAYSDIQTAEDAGYFNTVECVESPDGGMGVHLINESITDLDPDRPSILFYEPQDDGSFLLLGAEWFVPSESVSEAPVLFGQTFNGPMEGHGPGDPEHYDLHVWLGKTNPSGIFADFNPMVDCP